MSAGSGVGVRLLLLFCVVVWGWTFVATKILVDFVNPLELVGLRFGIGLPILFAVIRFKKIPLGSSAASGGPNGRTREINEVLRRR